MKNDRKISRRDFVDKTGKTVLMASAGAMTPCCSFAYAVPPLSLYASCGIYCGACPGLMKTRKATKKSEEGCLGCQSAKKAPGYAGQCKVRKCAMSKNIKQCGLCKSFPCEKFEGFFDGAAKYGLRKKYLEEVKAKGLDAWLEEQKKRWRCPECNTEFCYGDEKCPKCGKKVYSDKEEFEEYKKKG